MVQESLAQLSAELIRHARMLHALRAHIAAPAGVDWGALALLAELVRRGPRRQGELAGCAMLDPSTVSRHVAQLVRRGLVERRPDPLDGRAVQLVPTPSGQAMVVSMGQQRDAVLRSVLSGWSAQDIALLAGLLHRFNDDFEQYRPHLMER